MINIAICDIDNDFCSKLETILIEYSKENFLNFNIDIFNSGEQLYKFLKNGNKYNIIILDIEIGKINGIEIGRYIRKILKDEITKILYISYQFYYALELFKIRPFNFLIKPIYIGNILENISEMIDNLYIDYNVFYYKKNKTENKIHIKDILYFEGYNKNTKLVTLDNEIIINNKLKDIYQQLYKYRFFYSHRSYIVNYYAINKFKNDSLIMPNGHIIPISKSRKKDVKNLKFTTIKDT